MESLAKTKHQISAIMSRHGAMLGYVFGSYARNEMTPLSDIDVAVLFDPQIPRPEQVNRESKISADIGRLLQIDQVDVINLSKARSPLLKHRAILCGQSVLAKNTRTKMRLEKEVLQEYEDTRHLRNANALFLRRRLFETT